MAERIPAQLTKADAKMVGEAMTLGWWHLFKEVPQRWSILLLMAQSALETAQWARMMCWALGGVKSRDGDGYDFTFFTTSEHVSKAQAEKWLATASLRMDLQYINRLNIEFIGLRTDGKMKVKLYPDHPGCRFRAYHTLEESATDHISMLQRHKAFSAAWPAVLAGSPQAFARKLRDAGYYTAPVEQYEAGVVSYFTRFSKLDLVPSAILESIKPKDELDVQERQRVADSVQRSMQSLVDDLAEKGWK